jgi:bifunctional oligoribonuclease and PAP phosphatase NrnA
LKNFKFEQIALLIDKSRLVVVTSHHNPDGDAIGSALAMTALLKKLGKNAVAIVPNDYPSFLKWIPGAENLLIFQYHEEKAKNLIESADLIFCLDYNALNRTERMEKALSASSAKKVLIDHHLQPVESDFDIIYSIINISSTSELVCRFIDGCKWSDLLDKEIATSLYVGIMTDTGSFSFSCSNPDTFRIAASLIQTGIDPDQIHRYVYDTYSENRLRLLGFCLSEKLTVLQEFNTAFIALTASELDHFNYRTGDTEGIVNYALSIENVKIAVLLTERKDRIRLSFRSKGNLSVNSIAREHFAGGGHRNAAGGDSFLSLDETILKLRKALAQYKDEIDRSSF